VNEKAILATEWLLYIVMIVSFLHMAEIAYEANAQFQRMTQVAEKYNASMPILADLANLSISGSAIKTRTDALEDGRLTVKNWDPCNNNVTCGTD